MVTCFMPVPVSCTSGCLVGLCGLQRVLLSYLKFLFKIKTMCDNAIDIDLSEKLQSRLEKLEELTEFTENCQKKLDGLFAAFGWSPNTDGSIAQLEPTTVCPYDFHHIIPKQSLEKHVAFCRLNKLGYSKEEQAEMYDPSVFYEKANIPTMTIGEYSSAPVEVPENHKRAICDLTVADRLAIYNHVIAETSRQKSKTESAENDDLYVDLADKLKRDEDLNCPKSHLEVLAEMRDYKRRRQSYRAKNVHITKKSYTEVIREVIDVHSGELARLWQLEDETPHKAQGHSREGSLSRTATSQRRKSDDRRSASVESHRSHGSSKDAERSRHRRKRSRDRDSRRKRKSRSPDQRHRDHKRRK
ncbi:U11/U12 small nuclear ribonucleoprotein 48 kDa protein isoform X2 [Acipenser ruthenus]|uniref:U11/U12 small nuclear ribonucleoprotein 48 kDa protein isoform X2 n=1 Tax=Acipenser ruthenus TaxID=7906 RepID=UPI0027426861|nr:U11/U12 small nuclear ribonucleoprotein 48 kDa protein isoform X2 [Acipenser ruthenus]